SSFYAVYHGPDGLKAIAERVNHNARILATALAAVGRELVTDSFFDTLTVRVPGKARKVLTAAEARGINLRFIDEDTVGVSIDETTTAATLSAVAVAFGAGPVGDAQGFELPAAVLRTSDFLQHPVFNTHRSETQLLRYIRKLSDRDLALDRTMIRWVPAR
ncbi:glycine dehydrogenase, partial [Arthrobacter nitrophenolicus]